MSQIKFKFIEALEIVSPVYGALLQSGDKLTDVFSKLQGLLTWRSMRTTLSTTATGGINTTADFTIDTLTIPANTLQVGDVIQIVSNQNVAKGTGAVVYSAWFKVNGAKTGIYGKSFGNAASVSNGVRVFAILTVRSIGAGGVLVFGGYGVQGTTTDGINNNNPTITVNTTAAITLAVGANFSVANASNIISSHGGEIKLS
jgi:hypothetical protein